jgi:hypothetical protein
MGEIASIAIIDRGETSDALITCLRTRVADFNVAIATPDAQCVLVANPTASVTGLGHFLEEKLHECAQDLKVDWTQFLAVQRP